MISPVMHRVLTSTYSKHVLLSGFELSYGTGGARGDSCCSIMHSHYGNNVSNVVLDQQSI